MARYFDLKPGIVPFINVLPLVEGLEESFPAPVRATPRELADLLASGAIDIATLPVFDLLEHGHVLLPHCAIACDGAVRSVQLFSRVPLAEIRSVLVDRSSLTSAQLARILCAELLGIDPQYTLSDAPLRPDFDLGASAYDAVVVIGDTALRWESRFPHSLDLGEGWKRLTGLPFVFAGWVARPSTFVSAEAVEALCDCRRAGERNVYEIATREAGRHDGAVRDIVDYLSNAIRYRLGEAELQALDLYRLKLVDHGLLPASTPPVRLWTESTKDSDSAICGV